MHNAVWVGMGVRRLLRCVRVAESCGWRARLVSEHVLREHGVNSRVVELEHDDSPLILVLFRALGEQVYTGERKQNRRGYVWIDVLEQESVAEEALDDAPVAAFLANMIRKSVTADTADTAVA